MNGDESLEARVGNKAVAARGSSVIFVLVAIACAGATIYQVDLTRREVQAFFRDAELNRLRFAAERRAEHIAILASEDRMSCLLSLTMDERVQLRKTYTRNAFVQWCPWLDEASSAATR